MTDQNTQEKIVTLQIVPGPGKKRTAVPFGTTIADIVHAFKLFDRQIIADGEDIAPERYSEVVVDDLIEILAVGATKGAV